MTTLCGARKVVRTTNIYHAEFVSGNINYICSFYNFENRVNNHATNLPYPEYYGFQHQKV